MLTLSRFAAATLAAAAALGTVAVAPARADAPSKSTLAYRLVHDSAGVKAGDLVMIEGGPPFFALVEDLAVEVRRQGAHPFIHYVSGTLLRRYFDEVPAALDGGRGEAYAHGLQPFSVRIVIDSYGPEVYEGLPPERVMTVRASFMNVEPEFAERGLRQVFVGNHLAPLPSLARAQKMTVSELEAIFRAGLDVDYKALRDVGHKVAGGLKPGGQVRVTSPDGTDLRFTLGTRPATSMDGIVDSEDIHTGVYLPAGEVYAVILPGTTEGKLAVERTLYQNHEVTGAVVTFKAGRLVDMKARTGLDVMKGRYDAVKDDKKAIASMLAIGVNPNVRHASGQPVLSWAAAGMVTFGWGNNKTIGGDNDSAYRGPLFIPRATVTVDGKTVVDKGVLVTR